MPNFSAPSFRSSALMACTVVSARRFGTTIPCNFFRHALPVLVSGLVDVSLAFQIVDSVVKRVRLYASDQDYHQSNFSYINFRGPFILSFLVLHGRPASNWLTCPWGIIRSRCILYASAYQTRPVKRAPDGAAAATAYRFCPERIEQGISTLMLRRTHSRQLHAGASFAEMAARSFTGLERKGGRCCTAPFRYAGQPVSKFPGFHGKQLRRRWGLIPFAALPPIRSTLRHIKSSPASAVQGCLV